MRILATDFAVRQILHDGFAGGMSERTCFYVLWRWNYSEACGLDLAEE